MKARVLFGLVAAGLVIASAGIWLWQRGSVVPAAVVSTAPLVRTLQFSGRVATSSRVDVGSTVTGRVAQVMAAEGTAVRQGEVLLRLETDEQRAALDQARAGERQAAARLAGLRSTGRSAAQAVATQSDSVLLAAEAELQRTQDLVARGFLSPARLDEAKRAANVARAQQAGAQAQVAAISDRGSEVAQAEAQLALARAATTAAQARLDQSVIESPADARVLLRSVEPGQIVQPGRALFSLALAGPLQLVAQVDERYLQQLQVGQTASVLADAFAGQRFMARVASIAPLVDAQRGAVEVKLTPALPHPDFLREDMTLSIEVETARRANALVVPVDALRGDGAAPAVLVARDGRVEQRAVRLGLRTLQAVEVLEGLAAGDLVLLGSTVPEPGARVRPDTEARPAGRAGTGSAGAAMTNAMGR